MWTHLTFPGPLLKLGMHKPKRRQTVCYRSVDHFSELVVIDGGNKFWDSLEYVHFNILIMSMKWGNGLRKFLRNCPYTTVRLQNISCLRISKLKLSVKRAPDISLLFYLKHYLSAERVGFWSSGSSWLNLKEGESWRLLTIVSVPTLNFRVYAMV